MNTVDLFLRTYDKDQCWIPFLFRSMLRHVRGFRKLIILYPCDQIGPPGIGEWSARLISAGIVTSVECKPTDRKYPDDYVGQQVSKLRSFEYSDADEICFIDSDLVFVRDFTPESRRPLTIEARPWDAVGRAQCWYQPTKILLREEPPFETMARHPFQFPRELIERCYKHVGGEAALLGFGSHFSEFNLLGNYAIVFEGRPFRLVTLGESTTEQREDDWVYQAHSWSGITPKTEAKLRELGYWE